jgi:hypothetical protein
MDKLVRRVTVVRGSGEHRQTNVVYDNEDNDDDYERPVLRGLERGVRHLMKANAIAAQEAYRRHLESVEKGGNSWIVDVPLNVVKARRAALKELRKASPIKVRTLEINIEDEDEGD